MKLGRDLDSTWISKKSDGWSVEINVCSIHKGRPSMVRFNKPKNNLSQENEAKTRRTIFNYQSTGTGYLQVATSSDLVNPWHLPCCVTATIQGEWDLWRELCEATSRVGGRRRGLQSGNNPKSQEKRMRLSIIVKWRGYPITNASWEPEHTFSNDSDTLTHYKLQHNIWPQTIPTLCLLLTNKSTWTGNSISAWKHCMESLITCRI